MKMETALSKKFNAKSHDFKSLSVIIPTYNRNEVLLNTIDFLLLLNPAPAEILIIDQTKRHNALTANKLTQLEKSEKIRRIILPYPSIPRAMNIGLKLARYEIVLFLDDDIIPCNKLVDTHIKTHIDKKQNIVAGQVLQIGEKIFKDNQKSVFHFSSNQHQFVSEVMGGNFSIKRELAIDLGGFDENFIDVAYRFEAEFCERALKSGEKIFYEPAASIRHLKINSGGTRSFGNHLTTLKPSHSVGAYYYLLCSEGNLSRSCKIFFRPFHAVISRFHLKHPWWIPITLISELRGFFMAVKLKLNGPKYIGRISAQEKL
jgi:GT2 family glycosyltransferase